MVEKWWMTKNLKNSKITSKKKGKTGSTWNGGTQMESTARVSDQRLSVFAGTDLKTTISTTWRPGKLIALPRHLKGAIAKCLIISLFLARKTWNVFANIHVPSMIRMARGSALDRDARLVPDLRASTIAIASKHLICTRRYSSQEKNEKHKADKLTRSGCRIQTWLEGMVVSRLKTTCHLSMLKK